MATRPARNTAPEPKNQTPAFLAPEAWGTEETEAFNGHNPTDKADLIDTPFMVIGALIERNEGREATASSPARQPYDTAWVYALDIHGTEFEFSDSSSGVLAQIQAVLLEKGYNPAPGNGFQGPLRLRVMRGLRAQTYKVTDEETGKKRDATTYYFTTEGGRPAA